MEVKDAVRLAKEYVADLFEAEQITNVGLEEVVFDEPSDCWNVTIGFSRPWGRERAAGYRAGGEKPGAFLQGRSHQRPG